VSRRTLVSVLAAGIALAAIGGAVGARPKTMSVRMTFSGAYKGSVSRTHTANATTYACIQWVLPGKPLRYALIFADDYGAKPPSITIKFDYEAGSLGRAHPLGRALGGVTVTTPDGRQWGGLGGEGPAATVTLARDLRNGSFVVRNLPELSATTSRKLNVTGSWRCASVQRRTH
jgi:hypothetical protein